MKLRAAHILALVPLLAVAMRLASSSTASFSYLVLAGYALVGRAQAVQALALSWLFTMLSPGVAPETSASIGRYAVLAGAALSILFHSGFLLRMDRMRWSVVATILLGTFLVIHSLMFSPLVDVSVLKAMSWTVAAATLLSAWAGLPQGERDLLAKQMFAGLVVVMLVSLPLVVLPVGYLRNQTGFQGVLDHPQAFGPTMAFLGAWAASRMVAVPKPSWGLVSLVLVCLVLVVLSEARVAGFSLVLGVAVAIVIGPWLSGRRLPTLLPGLTSRRVYLVVGLSLVALTVAGPFLAQNISVYITKRSEAQSLVEAYDVSRGGIIRVMWENIQERPFSGTGFGIASVPSTMIVDHDPLLGLPTSASIEKGVMPVAVLEEVGVIGLSVVILWIWMLLRRAARGGGVTELAMVATVLLMNMGEFTLFSPGGMGLLPLILLAWAVTATKTVGSRT